MPASDERALAVHCGRYRVYKKVRNRKSRGRFAAAAAVRFFRQRLRTVGFFDRSVGLGSRNVDNSDGLIGRRPVEVLSKRSS